MKKRQHSGRIFVTATFLIVIFIFFALSIFAKPSSILNKTGAKWIYISLKDGKYIVKPELADNDFEQFDEMVGRLKPFAAITGTYYDGDYKPIGDIVCDGKIKCRGYQKQGIGFTKDGKILFFTRPRSAKIKWKNCYSGISCGPKLITNGKKDINVKRDGFSNDAKFVTASRCAIGAAKDGKLILCMVPDSITLDTMADVMLALNAKDAVNLDGGRSTALYINGKYHAKPIFSLNNILAVYKCKN